MTIADYENASTSPAEPICMQYFSDKLLVSNILAGSSALAPPQSIDSRDFTKSIRYFFNPDSPELSGV
jgi:hypothetical protein